LNACKDLPHPPKGEKRPEESLCKEVLRRLTLTPRYRTGPLEPHYESWLSDLESRADIRFSCARGMETYFLVEAKRLFVTLPGGKNASLVREYIDKGMMRFAEGRYAPSQQASAMLGYVFNVPCTVARDAVRQAINAAATRLFLRAGFDRSPLEVSPPVDETSHDFSGRTFILYHLFAAVSSSPPK
jgi:hypothetical protein